GPLGALAAPRCGRRIRVGAGGVRAAVLRARRSALPPPEPARARRMIDGLEIRPLLDGVRGAPPADVEAVIDALVRLSLLALDVGDLIDALDVNPLIAGPAGCIAVDALVIPSGGDRRARPPAPPDSMH